MINFDDFINIWNGKPCDVDGYYGYQCMDLAHRYAIDCVGKDVPAVGGAKDEWNLEIDGYEKIANSPTNVPAKGDIMIWGTGVGAYGHIAIFISGDANSFQSFDQNWPVGTYCHVQQHNYNGVLGWFHPKTQVQTDIVLDKATFEKLVTKSTEDDAYRALNFGSPNDIKVLIESYKKHEEELVKQYNDYVQSHPVIEPPQVPPVTPGSTTTGPYTLGPYTYYNGDIIVDRPLSFPVRLIKYDKTSS